MTGIAALQKTIGYTLGQMTTLAHSWAFYGYTYHINRRAALKTSSAARL